MLLVCHQCNFISLIIICLPFLFFILKEIYIDDFGFIGSKNEVQDIKSIGILKPATCTLVCKQIQQRSYCCCGAPTVCGKTRQGCRSRCKGDKCCATK